MSTSNELIFYTKKGCTLCDEALEFIVPMAEHSRLEIRKVDIEEAGDELWYRHRYRIPVVEFRGSEIAEGRIEREAFETKLRSLLSAD